MAKQWMKIAVLTGTVGLTRLCFAADVSGNWVATIAAQSDPQYTRVSLKADGDTLSGMWGTSNINGSLSDGKLDIKLTDAQGKPAGALTGTLSGDTITGSGTILGGGGGRGGRGGFGGGGMGGGTAASSAAGAPSGMGAAPPAPGSMARGGGGGFGGRGAPSGPVNFTLARAIAPPATPRSLNFEPTNFFATYSAANKPALSIFPGDVVHTSTADAGGVDAKGVRHRGGDSNIGPFFVEGALPGDTLVVHLLKVRTNRSTAHQATRINAHAVTAAYLVSAQYDPTVDGDWTLLPDRGIAVPTHPSEHMKNYSVPLKPMLGCISVAPAGDEQFRGGDLGPFGGNMDYNDNVEGTTLYFPVFHAGALLGMGDGHAAMGDGEVTGSALETSMDVDFSVEVIPGDSSGQVRAETKDYLIAFGVTGSVPDSIQVATSQLATWIKQKYKLSDSEVAILFASTLKYDITELVDSKYNVVAKVPKSVLATMK
ncbi:MAG TPA: acetamidase/formamidase family protein [Acidobacteriaceae bacterium]|jgi:acetamidase/formamidase